MNMISGCKTFISFSGFSGAHRAGPAFYAASGGWLAFGGKCWGAAAPPVAAAARHWGKASVVHPGAADLTYAAGQWDEGGEHFGLFEVLVHQLLKQCHRPLDSFQSNIVCSSFSLKMTKKIISHSWIPFVKLLSVRWRATLHIFEGCWKSVSVWLQTTRETMNTCDKSFTRSDNNKVNSVKMKLAVGSLSCGL